MTAAPTMPQLQRRLVAAIVASALTGAAMYLVVMGVAIPAIEARLTSSHVAWLRQAFAQHPVLVLGVILAVSLVLALPVLLVFRWVSGPWKDR